MASDPIDRTLVDHSRRDSRAASSKLYEAAALDDGARRGNRCSAIDIASMPSNYGTRLDMVFAS